ncbi:hypothetical protein MKX01_002956, partial [Papaver californicum]
VGKFLEEKGWRSYKEERNIRRQKFHPKLNIIEVALCIQMRGRSYSYSPSPPRGGYGRRVRSPSPRSRYGARSRDLPTSLLVRNLRRDCRPEDLRRPFGQFGPLKDIYLPRDYYTGVMKRSILKNFKSFLYSDTCKVSRDPCGFGFVQYIDPADAAEAKYQMDGQILHRRELTVVFAEENRKKPSDMRARERVRGRSYDRRRSPARHSLPTLFSVATQERYWSRSPGYYPRSPRPGRYTRSYSPEDRSPHKRGPMGRSRSRTPENYVRARKIIVI